MKKLSVSILFLLIAVFAAKAQQMVVGTGRFHASLGSPLEVVPEGTDGNLGSITPGSMKNLSDIPLEQRSVVFTINGAPGMTFNAGGIVEEFSESLSLKEITWEYFDFNSNRWISFAVSDNGDFENSVLDFTFNQQGQMKIRVYPQRMEASGDDTGKSMEHKDVFFDVTLSCFYTEI